MGVWSCEPRITGAKGKAWGRFSSGTFQRTWSCQHLDCRLAASRAVREYTAVVFSPPLAVLCPAALGQAHAGQSIASCPAHPLLTRGL